MKRILLYAGGVAVSFLPPRYRFWWPAESSEEFRRAAQFSGVVQFLTAMAAFIARLMDFWRIGGQINDVLLSQSAEIKVSTIGLGVLNMAEFLFQPLNMFLFYMIFESMVRLVAATSTGDILGTLPLHVVSGIHGLFKKAAFRRELGPLVLDQVVRGGGSKQGYDLKIYSCRPKLHWNPYMCIEYEDGFYQMFKEEPGSSPRRFIYYLRKSQPGHLAAVVDHYKIDDVMKADNRWDGTPRIRDQVAASLRGKQRVPDEIIRGSQRRTYDIKVYSSRPKLDWDYYVSIEFEEQLYQMFKQESGPAPRPFVYYLKKSPADRPVTEIRKYRPQE